MAKKLKAADVIQKDVSVSNLFLKFEFDQQKITLNFLKEPFAPLVVLNEFQSDEGWLEGARFTRYFRLLAR